MSEVIVSGSSDDADPEGAPDGHGPNDQDIDSPRTGPTDDAIVSFSLNVRLTADELRDLDQDQRDFLLAFAERLRG